MAITSRLTNKNKQIKKSTLSPTTTIMIITDSLMKSLYKRSRLKVPTITQRPGCIDKITINPALLLTNQLKNLKEYQFLNPFITWTASLTMIIPRITKALPALNPDQVWHSLLQRFLNSHKNIKATLKTLMLNDEKTSDKNTNKICRY